MSKDAAVSGQRQLQGKFGACKLVAIFFVFLLLISLFIVIRFRFHLSWKYESGRLGLSTIRATPDRPMPESQSPDSWLRCRVGCVEFSLPPELANNKVVKKNGTSPVTFMHDSRVVIVSMPENMSGFSDLLKTASKLSPHSQRFTLPRLRRECYQASSDDFRWSMTPEEVSWHAFCVTTSKLIRTHSDGYTESLFRRDWDGIAHFRRERVIFSWQSNVRMLGGSIHFVDHSENADQTWVREVCHSLEVLDDCDIQ